MTDREWVEHVQGPLAQPIHQLITSLLQIAMFVTPIFYAPNQLQGAMARIVEFNPLYHYVEIARLPLLGLAPSLYSYVVTIGGTIFGWLATLWNLQLGDILADDMDYIAGEESPDWLKIRIKEPT